MARTAVDLALALDVLAGTGARTSTDVAGLRVGVPHSWFRDATDPEVAAAADEVANVLGGLGATLVQLAVPEPALGVIAAWVITVAAFAEGATDWRTNTRAYTAPQPQPSEALRTGTERVRTCIYRWSS